MLFVQGCSLRSFCLKKIKIICPKYNAYKLTFILVLGQLHFLSVVISTCLRTVDFQYLLLVCSLIQFPDILIYYTGRKLIGIFRSNFFDSDRTYHPCFPSLQNFISLGSLLKRCITYF